MKHPYIPLSLTLACLAAAASAQEDRFTAEFSVEIESDYTFDSQDPDGEISDTFATIEGALAYRFTDQFSIASSLVFEPVEDAEDDRFFEDQGLYVEELFFTYDFGPVAVTAGKFNPLFGFAWDIAPGIFGTEYAEDYEITEKWGIGLAVPLEFGGGEHELTFAAFTADRTFLSESLGTNRGKLSQDDGGVSNTDNIESFALSLTGEIGDTGYTVGIQNQKAGEGDEEDQKGVALGVTHLLDVNGTPVELLGEVVYFDTFDGTEDSSTFATLGVAFPIGNVGVSAVLAQRDIDNAPTDRYATVTAEVPLADDLSLGFGYRYGDEEDIQNHTLGLLLAYAF